MRYTLVDQLHGRQSFAGAQSHRPARDGGRAQAREPFGDARRLDSLERAADVVEVDLSAVEELLLGLGAEAELAQDLEAPDL
jgi:hypothetical protein